MESYKEWIVRKYLGKDTPRGDMAYDVNRDEDFPKGLAGRERILNHLRFRRACRECVALFKRTWKDYCKDTGYQEG